METKMNTTELLETIKTLKNRQQSFEQQINLVVENRFANLKNKVTELIGDDKNFKISQIGQSFGIDALYRDKWYSKQCIGIMTQNFNYDNKSYVELNISTEAMSDKLIKKLVDLDIFGICYREQLQTSRYHKTLSNYKEHTYNKLKDYEFEFISLMVPELMNMNNVVLTRQNHELPGLEDSFGHIEVVKRNPKSVHVKLYKTYNNETVFVGERKALKYDDLTSIYHQEAKDKLFY